MKTMKAQQTRDVARAVRRVESHARKFVDEHVAGRRREGRAALLMVDLSATGYFGTTRARKREVAAEAAAVLGFAALHEGEPVGALLFTDRVELLLPPRKGRTAVLRIIREILFREPKGRGTDLCLALDRASRSLKARARAFLVTDFLLPGRVADEFTRLICTLRAARRRHEVVAVSVSDPRELELPNLG
ncbi:MAG TPA: VWA domain-containing protein, partial [Planctomycetota bacterium]|nr:VWA domain-containing protein [Planctomycetota bacterium]